MEKNYVWHNLSYQEIAGILETDLDKGLNEEEVRKRRKKFGLNIIPEEKPYSKIRIFLNQFRSPLIYILIFAGVITIALGKWTDSLVIFLAVFVNAFFGFWQENKVSNVLEKLKKAIKTKATVIRDGQKKEVFQEEIVPGDIIFLKQGDKVPADARLFSVDDLSVSEAVLTGEWMPSRKYTKVLSKNTSLADRENMVYMGSLVETGEGKAIVVACGSSTETGKIAALLKGTEEEKTPLQRKLSKFAKMIGIVIALLCVFIFVGGIFREGNILEMFESSVAIAVGGIPESLPIVMTVILTIGMEKILRKKGLVRRLSSVETLGSTDVICFDKTRTLTQGKMKLSKIIADDRDLALKISVLCSSAYIENPREHPRKWRIRGSATDRAVLEGAYIRGVSQVELRKKISQLTEVPFDSFLKYQLSLVKEDNELFLYVNGAPERILEKSKNKKKWENYLEELTKKGLRVIGVGYKKLPLSLEAQLRQSIKKLKEQAEGFTFVGLIALEDPLRKDVVESIKICRKAGMRPILATGDHKFTAAYTAQKIGLKTDEENIIEGKDLDQLSEEEFSKRLEKIEVYARLEPRHKMKIIEAWQKKGKIVAMTGDGVNDAPALKKADIGLALGSGTEVAKESADLILLNDSFSIIIRAIEEGRVILDNLRKSISYILADSFTSIVLIGLSKVVFGWPLPILPVQILWNNFVEDTLPEISYAFEPEEKDLMKKKPALFSGSLLTREMKVLIFGTGLIDEFITLTLFWWLGIKLGLDINYVRTIIFGAISMDTAFVVFCYKSLRKNIWQIDLFSNKWLVFSSLMVFLTFAFAVYFPPLQHILHTVPLGVYGWLIIIGVGLLSMFLVEITKWYFISRHNSDL
ncbi:HAD-IC family P-type ATPase [bacterium]|nr:HAD-IC family P-type ATPase [bacterium]